MVMAEPGPVNLYVMEDSSHSGRIQAGVIVSCLEWVLILGFRVKKIVLIAWMAVLMPMALPLMADTVITSHVAVESDGVANERKVLEEALVETVVMLTGNENVRENRVIPRLKKRLDEFLIEYRYEKSGQGWAIVAKFDQQALSQAIDKAGLVTQPINEEDVILWLVYQYPKRTPVIINTGSPGKLRTTLVKGLRAKGLRPLLPIMDLDDQQKVDPTDIMVGKDDGVVNASRRYGIPHYVAGVLQFDAGRWKIKLRSDRIPDNVSAQASSLGGSFNSALAILKSREQEMDQSEEVSSEPVLIQVAYVGSYDAYKRLNAYFNDSSQINHWRLLSSRGDTATIEVELSTSARRWLDTIRKERVLEHVAAPVELPSDEILYFFTLNP